MRKPSDFSDLELLSYFGLVEYEEDISKILGWLKTHGNDWDKEFTMEDVSIFPVRFAMLCSAGWIANNYFPKGTFFLSKEAIERLETKTAKKGKL